MTLTVPTLTLLDAGRTEEYRALLHAAYAENEKLGVHFAAATVTAEQAAVHLRENLAYGLDDAQGRLIGTVSLRTPWGPNPGRLGLPHVGWLATDPVHAPKGLGAHVLEALIEQVAIAQLHAPALSLGTASDHPWLGAYYQRLGFTYVGTDDLGLGHLTDFYIRPLDHPAYDGWRSRHVELLEGLTS